MSVTFESVRFGTVEIPPRTVIEFPFGLIGLGGHRYALLDRNPGTGFLWLHCVEDPALALPVVRSAPVLRRLHAASSQPRTASGRASRTSRAATVYVTVRATPDPLDITANLRAPLDRHRGPRLPGDQRRPRTRPCRRRCSRSPRRRRRPRARPTPPETAASAVARPGAPGAMLHNRGDADPDASPRRTRRHRRRHPRDRDGSQRPHGAARDRGAGGRLDLPRGDLARRQGGEPRGGRSGSRRSARRLPPTSPSGGAAPTAPASAAGAARRAPGRRAWHVFDLERRPGIDFALRRRSNPASAAVRLVGEAEWAHAWRDATFMEPGHLSAIAYRGPIEEGSGSGWGSCDGSQAVAWRRWRAGRVLFVALATTVAFGAMASSALAKKRRT